MRTRKTSSGDNGMIHPYILQGKVKFGHLGWTKSVIKRDKEGNLKITITEAIV